MSCLLAISLLAAGRLRAAEPMDKPLTNADVIKMLENKIPEGVILGKIETARSRFDTSTDAIIVLNRKGASESLLNAMLKARPAPIEAAPDPNTRDASVASSAEKPSALSYGTATGLIKKGITTQQELLEMFGGPNVMTTDKDGDEVWVYDKTASTISGNSNQKGKETSQSEAGNMAYYFGIPLIGGVSRLNGSAKDQSNREGHTETDLTTSVKTITFIIKFNMDKTVKGYSVRQASY